MQLLRGRSMLKIMIINELNKRLGRTASAIEQRDAYWNVIDMFEDGDTIDDLKHIMDDYIADTYVRCDQCGEMHRREETTDISGPYSCQRVCNNPDCEQAAYQDANYDVHREWATY